MRVYVSSTSLLVFLGSEYVCMYVLYLLSFMTLLYLFECNPHLSCDLNNNNYNGGLRNKVIDGMNGHCYLSC